jgi:hypothetical protein
MTITETTQPTVHQLPPAVVRKALAKRHYAVLATVSPAGRPHAAGVLYELAGTSLYVSTDLASRKGRNLAAGPHVGLTVPVRRSPVGPPSAIQFQATAELLALDDPQLLDLVAQGQLKSVTGHGELEREGGCIVRITPAATVHTYGLGMSLWRLIRDPLNAAGRSTWE